MARLVLRAGFATLIGAPGIVAGIVAAAAVVAGTEFDVVPLFLWGTLLAVPVTLPCAVGGVVVARTIAQRKRRAWTRRQWTAVGCISGCLLGATASTAVTLTTSQEYWLYSLALDGWQMALWTLMGLVVGAYVGAASWADLEQMRGV